MPCNGENELGRYAPHLFSFSSPTALWVSVNLHNFLLYIEETSCIWRKWTISLFVSIRLDWRPNRSSFVNVAPYYDFKILFGDCFIYLFSFNFVRWLSLQIPANRLSRRQGFSNRQAGRANGAANPGQPRPPNGPSAASSSNIPTNNAPASFPVAASPIDENMNAGSASPEPIKLFFIEENAKLGVKGNMMPLAAAPAMVDVAEWLAHQSEYELYC